jgi:hypothetical protein
LSNLNYIMFNQIKFLRFFSLLIKSKKSIFFKNLNFDTNLTRNIFFGKLIEPMVVENQFSCNSITSNKLKEKLIFLKINLYKVKIMKL